MWEIKSCKKNDIFYPRHMRDLESAPEVLYYVGDITACENTVIAVIGKRNSQERYLKIAKKIGELLAKEGYTVLNGLAIGCDACALQGAITVNGKAIGVMPCGLDKIYPKSNQMLAEEIIQKGGCLISEYPSGTKPQKYTFVQRDRIQAMLSDKILVVDSEKEGGTMHTAEYALKLAKPLGCFVEKPDQISPAGNRFLVDHNAAYAVYNNEALMHFIEQPEYTQMSLF